MATTISGSPHNVTARVAMDATAGNSEAVTLPVWVRTCTVTFRQSDGSDDTGSIAFSGTDGAAIGNNVMPVSSGGAYSFQAAPGRARIDGGLVVYLAGGTNSGYAYLHLEG